MDNLFLLLAAVATAGLVGLGGESVAGGFSSFRPEAGLALGILTRFGLPSWPIALLVLCVATPSQVVPLPVALVWAMLGTAQATATAILLRRSDHRPPTMRETLAGIGIVTAACAAGATAATITLECAGLLDPGSRIPFTLSWWFGDLSGCLLMAPAFVFAGQGRQSAPDTAQRLRRGVLALAGAAATWFGHAAVGLAAPLIALPMALVAGRRLGPGGAAPLLMSCGLASLAALTHDAVVVADLMASLGGVATHAISLLLLACGGLLAAARRPTAATDPTTGPTERSTTRPADPVSSDSLLDDEIPIDLDHELRQTLRNATPVESPRAKAPDHHDVDVDRILLGMKAELGLLIGSTDRLSVGTAAGTVRIQIDDTSFRHLVREIVLLAAEDATPHTRIAIRTTVQTSVHCTELVVEARDEVDDDADSSLGIMLQDAAEDLGRCDASLTTLRGMIESAGGHLEVDYNDIDTGVVYRALLPIDPVAIDDDAPDLWNWASDSDSDAPGTSGALPLETPAAREMVLVCQVNGVPQREMVETLTTLGLRVVVADRPEDALTILAANANHLALAVLDDLLPGQSGIDLGRRLRSVVQNLPIILTGIQRPNPALAAAIDSEDAIAWIRKPLRIEELTHEVRRLVGSAPASDGAPTSVTDLLSHFPG